VKDTSPFGPRQRCVNAKLTPDEFAVLERAAGTQNINAWARAALLRAASARTIDEVIVSEVIALRTIILALAVASKPTAEDVRGLAARADEEKLRRARELLGWRLEAAP
jgi:hypothetical protein